MKPHKTRRELMQIGIHYFEVRLVFTLLSATREAI